MTEDRAISLNAVIKAVDQHTNDDGTLDDDISCILEDLPPVTPQPKTGHWIEYDNSHCECPKCHREWSYFENEVEAFDYCPKCGTKLD